MENNEISKKIKKLRKQKGYSLEAIAQMIPVSKQGYHLWEQNLRTWKIDTLSILSKILDFKIVVEDGGIEIIECSSQEKKENERKEVDIMKNNTELKGYEVITLYTGAENINFEEKEVLDEVLIYREKEDAIDVFDTDVLVPIYALYDIESGNICSNTYGLDKVKAYSMYFWNYAPILDDENTVYIDMNRNIKIGKRYVFVDVNYPNEDGTYPVLSVQNKKSDKAIGMFFISDLEGFKVPQMDMFSVYFPDVLK